MSKEIETEKFNKNNNRLEPLLSQVTDQKKFIDKLNRD
jgi:hypothetical protein|tara:strand:+ start:701 stop:814 length:114 start_codon:yes stop_codon:yes gene_type:complete